MGFYYVSVFSIVPLGIAYGLLALMYWAIARGIPAVPGRKAILAVLGVVFLILPISEELWIAWSFGQACKESGTVINKKVQADGFYDDTTHWWRQLAESKYEFVESRDRLNDSLWRVERVGNELKHFKIDRPTARYQYKLPDSHASVVHKIVKHQAIVIDTVAGEVLGKYTRFSRDAPWFYWSVRGDFSCDAPGRWPMTRGSFQVYDQVLTPSVSK